jgi:hypothetical protein
MVEFFLMASFWFIVAVFIVTGDIDVVFGFSLALLIFWVAFFMGNWMLSLLFFYPAWREYRRSYR